MTREFERDSKIPMAAVVVGLVVSCFATWYAIHCAWEMFSPPGFDWCGHEASAVFRAARGTIVLSTMLSASIAILIRLARSKDASTLGYLTAYTKLALVVFMAMRMSAVVGFSFGTFVPKSSDPLPVIGGWRCFQIAHIVAMLTLIPAGLCFMELVQKRLLTAKTWIGRGIVCALLALSGISGQCLWALDWVGMVKVQETEEESPQTSPFDDYRLTEDEPGESMA